MSIKDISYKGFRYHGKLITSVITGRDATRAQIPPGLVQINLEGDCGTANASGGVHRSVGSIPVLNNPAPVTLQNPPKGVFLWLPYTNPPDIKKRPVGRCGGSQRGG